MKTIVLSNGNRCVVDDEYYFLDKHKWCQSSRGYAIRNVNRKTVSMHRVIMNLKDYKTDTIQVDHINHNKLDNRVANLRLCSPSQNQANGSKGKETSSRYKGVWWHKVHKKWTACITVSGKHIFLGNYADEKSAAIVYDSKAKELFGEFANLNF